MNHKKATYQSELRAEQVAATRARIVEAAVERFAPWSTELPFDKVAQQARVSERTVYRHFPTQKDLLAAVRTHLIEHSGWDTTVSAEDLGAMTARAFAYIGSLLDGGEHTPEHISPEMQRLRERRLEMIERAIGPHTKGMDPELARGICAVFAGLARLHFMRTMYEHWELSGAGAGRAVEWAINALLAELQREEKTWDTKPHPKAPAEERE